MPKLIVNDKRLFGRENGLDSEIDGGSNRLSLDKRQELGKIMENISDN